MTSLAPGDSRRDPRLFRRKFRRGICRALAVAALAFTTAVGPAFAGSHEAVPDTPELDRLFPVQQQTADYIVVLDRSLSMKRYWSATAAALSTFAGAIPDGDHLAFVTFDKHASNSLIIPRVLTSSSRPALLAEIDKVPPPLRRKGEDDWNYTDIGEALAKTLDEINRPNSNTLSFVFLLTDFVHEPAPGHFQSTDLESPGWKALVERGRLLREGRVLRSFALILPVDGRAGQDIGLVRGVLGEVPEVRMDATTLGPWFERMAKEIRREKLAALVQGDLAKGWEWSVRAERRRTILQLHSRLKRLPVRVAINNATLDGQTLSLPEIRERSVSPGQTIDFPLETSPCTGRMPWWRRLLMISRTDVRKGRVAIAGDIGLDPAGELVKIGLVPRRPLEASVEGLVARPNCGVPLWVQVLVILGVVGVSAATWTTWLRPAPPVRSYARKVMLSGPAYSESLELPLDRSRILLVGNTADATVRSRLDPPGWAVTLVSRKPEFLRLRPRRGLYAYRSTGQVYHRGREYDGATRRWVERDIPLPESLSRALPVGFQTKLVVQHAGERLQMTLHSR